MSLERERVVLGTADLSLEPMRYQVVQDVTGTRKGRCLGRWLVGATNDNRWSKMTQEQGRGGAWGSCLVEELIK